MVRARSNWSSVQDSDMPGFKAILGRLHVQTKQVEGSLASPRRIGPARDAEGRVVGRQIVPTVQAPVRPESGQGQ